jgi:drug/metabolite transporter (DMT)-like permease
MLTHKNINQSTMFHVETITKEQESKKRSMKKLLLILNSVLLAIGTCGGPLVMRLYFIHGGNRVWLSSFLETSAFPIILIPITISHIHNRYSNCNGNNNNDHLVSMKLPIFFASALIGILTGLDDYLYACGIKRLPVSTSSLIQSSHLAFTAVFAYILVKHKFTAYSVNSIVLLTLGSVVLALNSNGGDRLVGESTKEYVIGFVMILASAALYGFVLPLLELVYKKSKQVITYSLVMEIQFVMCFFATLFCLVGMFIDNDFKVSYLSSTLFFFPSILEFYFYRCLV